MSAIPPHLMTEANIQAEFFGVCRTLGMNCALEVCTPVGRLDVAVFSDDWSHLLAIVECKHNAERKVGMSPQIRRYKQIGVPVFGLACLTRCLNLAITIQKLQGSGVMWASVLVMNPTLPRRKARVRGADGVLRKPFHPSSLDSDINLKN